MKVNGSHELGQTSLANYRPHSVYFLCLLEVLLTQAQCHFTECIEVTESQSSSSEQLGHPYLQSLLALCITMLNHGAKDYLQLSQSFAQESRDKVFLTSSPNAILVLENREKARD